MGIPIGWILQTENWVFFGGQKIDSIKKKIVDDSISKREIEKLKELEEEIQKKIEIMKSSSDLPDTG